jgi:Fe-S cluster assembly protein SufB
MSISEAIKEHPELVRKYLGTVIPQRLCSFEFRSFL